MQTSTDYYPASNDVEHEAACLDYLLTTLLTFLERVIHGTNAGVKVASIGQAIMQATRPRVPLAPLRISLAVQLHHHFASRFLIESLHNMGFCAPYKEVKRFGRNAAVDQGIDIPQGDFQFVQYSADNVCWKRWIGHDGGIIY